MLLTDTHTHLYYETDPVLREELMHRCFEKGVSRLFLPNVDSASIPLVFDLSERYPENCFPMMGLHPCNVKADYISELEKITDAIQHNKIYAIGEIGIDLYWDKTTLEVQQQAFIQQIRLAKQMDLPIVIHCRDAFNEVYDILQKENDDKLRGIFHCFTGTKEQADQVIELGFYLGIGGVVTYKNSGLDKVVAQLDPRHLVIETDSPYLAPVPYRGKSNESSYLIHIAQKISDLHELAIEEIARITTENSKQIFGI